MTLTSNKFHDPMKHEQNRQKFADEQDIRGQRPRNALFSMPLGITIGDSSTVYQTFRKEKHQVGLKKGMSVAREKGAKETFGKFQSNALGDPYQDPGKYNANLRRTNAKTPLPFTTSSNKKVRRSEFPYIEQGPPQRSIPETAPRFGTRVKNEPFTNLNKLGYAVDPYEGKQEMGRAEYAQRNSLILHRDQPWNNTVRQKGTFFPSMATFGTNIAFPQKAKEVKKQPLYGPFKRGDPLKTGYNKTIGGHGRTSEDRYVEEMEEDKVQYRKNVASSGVWKGVTRDLTMMNATTLNNNRNINRERKNIF